MIRVFVGYDPTEITAFHVLCQSIHERATEPVSITPLKLGQLAQTYVRPREANHSTEFSLSRFMVPLLCKFQGWAIFMDCDMMFREDIAELWNLKDPTKAVQVVKHDYEPSTTRKMRGAIQTFYEKKNWSSLMLFNNTRCRKLGPSYVNRASGMEMHQFKWLANDDLIGALPATWNHLVGEYPHDPTASCIHWTLGGPWWGEFEDVDYAVEWREARVKLLGEL